MMTRPHFLKLALGVLLAPFAAWLPKKKPGRFQVHDARLLINGVEVPLQGPPDFGFVPRYDGDRAVMVGEWTCGGSFDVSLVEPIDEHTWTELFPGGFRE